jgi:hypothetical protein
MTFTVLRVGQVLCRLSLKWSLSDVFFMVKLRLKTFGRKTTEVERHSYHILSRVGTTSMTYCCWHWHWSPIGFIFINFLHLKLFWLFLFLFFPTLFFKGSQMRSSPHFWRGELSSILSRVEYYKNYLGFFFMGGLLTFPIISFVYINIF